MTSSNLKPPTSTEVAFRLGKLNFDGPQNTSASLRLLAEWARQDKLRVAAKDIGGTLLITVEETR